MAALPTLTDSSSCHSEGAVELSVVLPCLDEAETVGACVERARRAIESLGVAGEVVVADNGSTDGSQELAVARGARVVPVREKGYGSALMGGILAARGRFVAMADSDGSYDLGALGPFLEKLRGGSDLVMGNRFRGGIQPGAMPFLHRFLGNPVLSWVGRLFFGSPVGDFHCGMRAFRRDSILRLGLVTTGMEFATEMIVKASLVGLAIEEVPIVLAPAGRTRPPHLRTWRDGWRHLRFMLLYSPAWLFLYPGLVLMALGLAGGAWLTSGIVYVGELSLDVHTLLYMAAFVLVGYQSVLFYLVTRVFAFEEGFLPRDPLLGRLYRFLDLEKGLIGGLLLVGGGLAGSVLSVLDWKDRAYGVLDPTETLRVVIPAVLALVLGLQTMMSSFLVSFLRLGRARAKADDRGGRSPPDP